jgi:hypothetical protein
MQTFKEHYLTEAKKAVSREQAEEYLNTIKRQINPEMSDPVRQNGDWWDLMIRDHDFFTDRGGEEDDDHPNFTGDKRLNKILKSILKGVEFQYSPEEKGWITILLKAKKLTKKQLAADVKKKIQPVIDAARNEIYNADDRWDRDYYEQLVDVLKKWKKKFIKKEQFFDLQKSVKHGDDENANNIWWKAK